MARAQTPYIGVAAALALVDPREAGLAWLRSVAVHAARAWHGSARQATASESAAGTGRIVELTIDEDVTQRGQVLIQARRLPVSRLARRGCYPFHH
jgi:hypothetical protein